MDIISSASQNTNTSGVFNFWSPWLSPILCCPLNWQPISLRSVEVNPCFVHCQILYEKIACILLKQFHTLLWIINTFLFLVNCEQMRNSFPTELSFTQILVHGLLIHLRYQLSHVLSQYGFSKRFCRFI